jgi:hypothetical protein
MRVCARAQTRIAHALGFAVRREILVSDDGDDANKSTLPHDDDGDGETLVPGVLVRQIGCA